jgi:ribosome-interacting GTPase 1
MSDPRIRDLIQYAVDDNPVEVKNTFDELMLDRIRDIIDQRKIEVAASFIQANPEFDDLADEVEAELENADYDNNEE